jgi:inorganic triphosphatase YgiF
MLRLTKLRDTPLASVASMRSLSQRLQPVFTTDFRRESRILRLGDGCEIEFALDVGWIRSGRGRAARSLPVSEVELEVKVAGTDDPVAALLRFARRLARDVPLIPLAESKAARGYRLADRRGVAPSKAVLPVAAARDPASLHLAGVISSCANALLDNVHALIEQRTADETAPIDPGFVHQARVAIRRLRSALRTFRPVAKGRRFESLEERLQALGQMFGDARDRDVFACETMDRLAEKVAFDDAGRAALADLRADLESHRGDAYRRLSRQLDEGPLGAVAIELMRIAKGLEDDPADAAQAGRQRGPTLGDCAPLWLDRQRARIVRQSRRIAVLDAVQRHGLRVEVKRMRYALDLFHALCDPSSIDAFHDALSELQTRLGRLNDEVVADRLLRALAPGPSRDLVVTRHAAWFGPHVKKQLPRVAALSVALELTHEPWSREPPRRFG